MHRISVFRDDVIFILYMIQRRIYPVDRDRPVEGFDDDTTSGTQGSKAEVVEEEEEEEEEEEQQQQQQQ